METNTTNHEPEALVPEGTRHAFWDLVLEHWPRIAATAWEGYRVHGRGTVMIEDGSTPPALTYRPGVPCACCEALAAGYSPETEALVAVVRAARRQIRGGPYVLGGWPTPRDAGEHAPASLTGAIVH